MYDLQLLKYADRTRDTDESSARPTSEIYTKIAVQHFRAASSCFCSSLYRNASSGRYHITFAGRNDLSAFVMPKRALEVREAAALWGRLSAKWHVEMSDALWFSFQALKQVRTELHSRLGCEPSLEDLRPLVHVSGHAIGGALAELVSQFFGLKGFNIDGPGAQALMQHGEFAAMKVLVGEEFADLQPRYEFQPGDFVANGFSVMGLAGTHAEGVSCEGAMELGHIVWDLAGLGDENEL